MFQKCIFVLAIDYDVVVKGLKPKFGELTDKNDTVSHLTSTSEACFGIWDGDLWKPEPGSMYLFNDGATYWVTPGSYGRTHVCKHYSGNRMSAEGQYWRYTILAKNTDPDLTSEFYIGTRAPVLYRGGIHGILKAYGLKDLRTSFVLGSKNCDPSDRPFGEPPIENWYWDAPEPDDELFRAMKRMGFVNNNGCFTEV